MDQGEPIPGAVPSEIKKQRNKSAESSEISAESSLNIERVKKELFDPRLISRKKDAEGRSETASAVMAVRKIESATEETNELVQEEKKLEGRVSERLENVLVKIKEVVGFEDKQVAELEAEREEVEGKRKDLLRELAEAERELEKLKGRQLETPSPPELIEAYYEKMATQPLSKEEKRELLTPEVLASLTTEEYIALWKRLNPYFLTHVTRQGFRDHTGGDVMVDHTSGYLEYISGFVDVMENGRAIFPPLARIGLEDREDETVRDFLSPFLEESEFADEAKDGFVKFLNRHLASAPKYPDITSTHFAAQIVSDRYYGGERGNEVFFVYPSDVIASQYAYAFNGWEKDFTEPQSEVKWNDVFVWTDPNNPGVPVDSGIVFLPKSTPVDPETGSKYASELRTIDGEKKRIIIENPDLVNAFVEWGGSLDNEVDLRKALIDYRDERHYTRSQDLREECLTAFSQKVEGLGFDPDVSRILASKIIKEMMWREELDDRMLEAIVENTGAHLKRAEKTIPANEYWESFFDVNPDLRPRHVQYYDGDPTSSILRFQREHDIGKADTSEEDGKLLGFDDNHVVNMGEDPRSNRGYDELLETANRLIDDHFSSH